MKNKREQSIGGMGGDAHTPVTRATPSRDIETVLRFMWRELIGLLCVLCGM
jgi:hypothetical protein